MKSVWGDFIVQLYVPQKLTESYKSWHLWFHKQWQKIKLDSFVFKYSKYKYILDKEVDT